MAYLFNFNLNKYLDNRKSGVYLGYTPLFRNYDIKSASLCEDSKGRDL